MNTPTKVLIAHDQAELYLDHFSKRFPNVDYRVAGNAADIRTLQADWSPTVAYSCTTHTFARNEHQSIQDLPSIQWIHVGGSGYEHFDGRDQNRIRLSNGVGVLAPFLADTVMGAMIALNNRFFDFRQHQKQRTWKPYQYRALRDQTLLIVGTGAVGSALAKVAKAHGMKVVGAARRAIPIQGFDDVEPLSNIEDLLPRADWVSLHLRLSHETERLFDRKLFDRMQPHAYFINTSRGGVVDEAALIDKLESKEIMGAYLDVTTIEPLPEHSPIWHIDNLFLTPHCSDQVFDWQERHAALFMDNLERWLGSQPLLNEVDAKIVR